MGDRDLVTMKDVQDTQKAILTVKSRAEDAGQYAVASFMELAYLATVKATEHAAIDRIEMGRLGRLKNAAPHELL